MKAWQKRKSRIKLELISLNVFRYNDGDNFGIYRYFF